MSSLLNLNDAAKFLGISVEKLKDLRAQNIISAVRVGSDWKFKQSELDRVKKLVASLSDPSDASDFELSDSSGGESVLVDDSDESVEMAKPKGGHILDDDDEISFGESSLDLAAGSSGKLKTSDNVLDDGPESDEEPALSTGKLVGGNDDLQLIDDSSDSDSPAGSSEMSSDFDDDSELELDDSDSSAELQLNKGKKPGSGDDFALSDDVLELGGSDIDDFELSDSSDLISLVDSAEQDAATLMQDDDFNLTPMEDSEADDTSGSQVIALEDSDLFADDSAATQLSPQGFAPQPGLMPATGFEPAYAPATTVAATPEVAYSALQVLALAACALIMLLGGIIAFEIARNMWMPDDQVLRTGLLQMLMDLFQFS